MASYARCLLFLLFAISFFLQIHARESKFFSKVAKTTKKNNNAIDISLSPSVSPTLAPALTPEPEVVEHGYGLYGRDPYENTPTKTVTPTKKPISGEQEKYVPAQELSQTENYGDNYKPGYTAVPYYPPKSEMLTKNTILGNEKYVPAQELSQTENYGDNYAPGYGSYQPGYPTTPGYHYPPKSEMLTKNTILGDKKYVHVEQSSNNNVNENKYQYSPSTRNPVYVSERQGMSDTRFLENGKYYYDVNQDSKDVSRFVENQGNGYVTKERKGNYGGTKKFPNEYDTMEEYDREQGYIDPQDVYVP